MPFVDINPQKDKEWNSRKINAELLQAIENGESITKMSERLQRVTDMNKVSAMRNARTMTTSFENLGRLDGMKKMQENGTILKKKWLATNDSKTRDAHAQLNGVVAEVDEPFINYPNGKDKEEIMYPGDPSASPANIYNCRCTLTYEIEGFEPTLSKDTIISIEGNNNYSGWMPNFDNFDIYDLKECMLDIGKKYSEINKMSEYEMKSELEKMYMKTANEIKQFKKTKNAKKIAELLQNLPEKSIPERFNRDSLFQRYTLFELNGDLPDVVDDLSKVQGVNIYRGVLDAQNITGKEICDMTKYDPEGFVGRGMYGDGTYFSTYPFTAESYSGYGNGAIIEAKLKPTAKVIDYEYCNSMVRKEGGEILDEAIWGAVNGYDAIKVSHKSGEDYYIILKRSCLWIKK